jgi:hypothetical protein
MLARPNCRFWSIPEFSLPEFSLLVVYDTESNPVQVLRIVHRARDLPKLLKGLSP